MSPGNWSGGPIVVKDQTGDVHLELEGRYWRVSPVDVALSRGIDRAWVGEGELRRRPEPWYRVTVAAWAAWAARAARAAAAR